MKGAALLGAFASGILFAVGLGVDRRDPRQQRTC